MEESRFQYIMNRIGLILLGIFYVVSIIMVVNSGAVGSGILGKEKRLTFAHWQLEDGFREGFEDAIKEYERIKAEQGVKVKVVQTTVPVRGYAQWFLTQLIGGDCADVIELSGNDDIRNQYFTPLSQYLGDPNPYNKGTPLEGMPWRDTFADDMITALSQQYSEYFGVSTFVMTTRMYVNVDLYEKAMGHKRMPETLQEWLDACKKIQEYGKKVDRPLIPIGVRGFDKGTIGQILNHYNDQINASYNDSISDYAYGTSNYEIYKRIAEKDPRVDLDRFLQPVEITTAIGRYFAKGFSAIDLEQTKFLFNSGNVAFFIDGTWNAFSMVNNSNFKVDVIPIPSIGKKPGLISVPGIREGAKYNYLGRMTEVGGGLGGLFGIPKSTKHPELALDFLHFITSYRISQLTMIRHSKWLSPLKKVDYAEAFNDEIGKMCHCKNNSVKTLSPAEKKEQVELLQKCRPYEGSGYSNITTINSIGSKTVKDNILTLETMIIEQPKNPKQIFWNTIVNRVPDALREIEETIITEKRTHWNNDGIRTAFTIGALVDKKTYENRIRLTMEGMVGRVKMLDDLLEVPSNLRKLEEIK